MKKTLFLAFMLMIAANLFAQQQIATLNHNDSISMFYGSNAFVDAHNAAVAGDIVTLSSGSFNSCNITKAITIRGAGFYMDSIAMTDPTIITGDFKLLSPNDSIHNLVMEGINVNNEVSYYDVINAKFNRCFINRWDYLYYNGGYGSCYNTEFVNCIIESFSSSSSSRSSYSIVNSVLYHSVMYDDDAILLNSIPIMSSSHRNITAYNSIIAKNTHGGYLYGNAIAFNCILIKNGYSYDVWSNPNNSTNKTVENQSDVFETFKSTNTNDFSIDERYILKEEIATSFLGNDGTEVGIHGGLFPFDTKPSYMVVKKCNVAKKSTIDGKLSVDIEVMVEE